MKKSQKQIVDVDTQKIYSGIILCFNGIQKVHVYRIETMKKILFCNNLIAKVINIIKKGNSKKYID